MFAGISTSSVRYPFNPLPQNQVSKCPFCAPFGFVSSISKAICAV